MLGIPYTNQIDIWSFGCVLGELFYGLPIFPGKDENEQMNMIIELNGLPSLKLLEQGERSSIFFDVNGDFIFMNKNNFRKPNSKNISQLINSKNEQFNDFLKVLLNRNA